MSRTTEITLDGILRGKLQSCLKLRTFQNPFNKDKSVHCCMKCPQILREKTSSEKYTVISLRIQWKLFAEGNAFRKCQQIILPLIIINAIIFKGQN